MAGLPVPVKDRLQVEPCVPGADLESGPRSWVPVEKDDAVTQDSVREIDRCAVENDNVYGEPGGSLQRRLDLPGNVLELLFGRPFEQETHVRDRNFDFRRQRG